ncbi:MAG TPA: carboxypeptidase regulatory-like domain-containing protein [Vicinamibacterales bacterium]|nr:carboxypeptidase regulatory-like domain-containing protein [Vicinamibacterales bacterium]
MRTALLFSLIIVAASIASAQSTPGPTPPKQASPAQPAPARPRTTTRPAAAARSGIAVTVTDTNGTMLSDVHVDVTGPMERMGDTNSLGQVNFPGLPPGTYTLRFTADDVLGFEREATLRGGAVTTLQIRLTPAPKKEAPPPPKPAAAPAPQVGPVGSPQWGSLQDLLKKAESAKPPLRELMLSCSGNTRSMLVLLTEDQAQRVYKDGESTYYVLDGQGSVKIGDRDGEVTTGSFVSVPRGMPFTITVNPRSKKPLAVLWVLSGERCEAAR